MSTGSRRNGLLGCPRTALLGALAACALGLALPGPARANDVPFQAGVTLGQWGPDAFPPEQTGRALKKIKNQFSAQSVTIFVDWTQNTLSSTDIHRGPLTVKNKVLVAAIKSAQRRGLSVVLRPYIDPANGGWRGFIHPTSVSDWFDSYRRFILKYAALAQRNRVKGFVVGSELEALEDETAEWLSIVRSVRSKFKGWITYQANWGTYQDVEWWPVLDVIDISAYFPLSDAQTYTEGDLVAGWHDYNGNDWFTGIEAVHNETGLPVLFGEIGYRSIEGGAQRPWDVDIVAPSSAEAQRVAYAAAFEVWFQVPWFKGFFWWFVPATPIGNYPGADHAPRKPARAEIQSRYGALF